MHSHLLWSVLKVLVLIKLLVVGLLVAVLVHKRITESSRASKLARQQL
jgi:Tfp pilus assembly protein PilX